MRKISIGPWSGITWTSIHTINSHQYLIFVLLLIVLPIDVVWATTALPLNRSSITIIKVGARATNSAQNDKVGGIFFLPLKVQNIKW